MKNEIMLRFLCAGEARDTAVFAALWFDGPTSFLLKLSWCSARAA